MKMIGEILATVFGGLFMLLCFLISLVQWLFMIAVPLIILAAVIGALT